MENKFNVQHLNNNSLLEGLKRNLSEERHSQALFLAHLAEVDGRRLYAELAYTSLFAYCTEVLKLSEGSTCRRIQAARTAKKYPVLFEYIEKGDIHLEAISLIAPLLTDENNQDLIQRACHKTKREVELLVASFAPRPDLPEIVRKLPTKHPMAKPTFAGECCKSGTLFDPPLPSNSEIQVEIEQRAHPEVVKPLSPERYKIQLTGSERLKNKIERAKALLRHKFPEGRLEDILEAALDVLLEKKDPKLKMRRKGQVGKNRFGVPPKLQNGFSTRHIPEKIKHEVWVRDHGQCSFISEDGKRCNANAWLEYDHIRPWALGGASNNSDNIRLLCRAHNQLESNRLFGGWGKRKKCDSEATNFETRR